MFGKNIADAVKRISILQAVILLCIAVPFSYADFPTNAESVTSIFSGGERLHYSITWNRGVKIGDLYIQVVNDPESGQHTIQAQVHDYGVFRLFYPVNDTFTTRIRGAEKLPIAYSVHQREGRSKETFREYRYDQENHTVTYRKNKQPEQEFQVNGPVYNEFASFFATRILDFNGPQPFYIPTFADRKRHEVEVKVLQRKEIDSVYGRVSAVEVMPLLSFKGLYDKKGDTVIWLTEDSCRVPLLIKSKIVVGALRADLLEYSNPACPQYTLVRQE